MVAYHKFTEYYDKFIENVAVSLSDREIAEAREEFFDLSGRVTETDPSMELRYQWFNEYLVFDYKIDGLSPAQRILKTYRDFSEHEHRIFLGFTNFVSGIFLTKSIRSDIISVNNLYDDKTYNVIVPSEGSILEKGAIFQGKLFSFQSEYFISPSVLIHPEFVSWLIVKVFKKKIKGDDLRFKEFFYLLSRLKLKQERFPRVPPVEIYRQVLENESSWIYKIA